MKLTYVYYFAALDTLKDEQLKSELDTLEASIESLQALKISKEVLLITNSRFSSHVKEGLFDSVLIDDSITLANLDYKRVLLQRRVIKDRHNASISPFIAFVDHDVLFSSDISPFFSYDFDFGITANFSTHFLFDSFHLPVNTGVASINAGVQLCKASPASLSFMDEKLRMCTWAQANRDLIPTPLNPSPLSWGCDQISMMLLLNEEIFIKHRTGFEAAGAKIRAFSTNTLNYSPDLGKQYILNEFHDHYIWHFKGNRKPYMRQFWNTLKAASMV